jgi:hypothetical protein
MSHGYRYVSRQRSGMVPILCGSVLLGKCVQASIDQQLEQWQKEHKERKVGLVTFASDVTVVSFGSTVRVPACIDSFD